MKQSKDYNPHFDSSHKDSVINWCCAQCGRNSLQLAENKGKKQFEASTWHEGVCDVCLKPATVTEPRDYGYPDFNGIKIILDVLRAANQDQRELVENCKCFCHTLPPVPPCPCLLDSDKKPCPCMCHSLHHSLQSCCKCPSDLFARGLTPNKVFIDELVSDKKPQSQQLIEGWEENASAGTVGSIHKKTCVWDKIAIRRFIRSLLKRQHNHSVKLCIEAVEEVLTHGYAKIEGLGDALEALKKLLTENNT